jgi:hypothetical protein
MFLIQTQEVIEKSRLKTKKAKDKAESSASLQATGRSEDVNEAGLGDRVILFSRQHLEFPGPGPWVLTIPQFILAPTIEQRARGFFQTHSQRWLRDADLVGEMVSQTHGDEHLLASMYAVGLASFSNHIHSNELMARAKKGYVTALRLTNAALRSLTDVKKDSTLFAILILGVFETVTGANTQSVLAWTSHIQGATALVESRGIDQFNSEAGQRMFYQVISSLIIICIQQAVHIPERIVELMNAAEKVVYIPHPVRALFRVLIDFAAFRADVQECRIAGLDQLIKAALAIDQRFINTFSQPPIDWQYQLEHTDKEPDLVWNKTYHKYCHRWAVPLWNSMRACRLMLHETIRDQLRSSTSATTLEFTDAAADAQDSSSASICLEMQREILRSIPGRHLLRSDLVESELLFAGMHQAYMLWPLYVVGIMDLATDRAKKWVIRRLQIMSEEEGIRQAGVLADHLDRSTRFWAQELGSGP